MCAGGALARSASADESQETSGFDLREAQQHSSRNFRKQRLSFYGQLTIIIDDLGVVQIARNVVVSEMQVGA